MACTYRRACYRKGVTPSKDALASLPWCENRDHHPTLASPTIRTSDIPPSPHTDPSYPSIAPIVWQYVYSYIQSPDARIRSLAITALRTLLRQHHPHPLPTSSADIRKIWTILRHRCRDQDRPHLHEVLASYMQVAPPDDRRWMWHDLWPSDDRSLSYEDIKQAVRVTIHLDPSTYPEMTERILRCLHDHRRHVRELGIDVMVAWQHHPSLHDWTIDRLSEALHREPECDIRIRIASILIRLAPHRWIGYPTIQEDIRFVVRHKRTITDLERVIPIISLLPMVEIDETVCTALESVIQSPTADPDTIRQALMLYGRIAVIGHNRTLMSRWMKMVQRASHNGKLSHDTIIACTPLIRNTPLGEIIRTFAATSIGQFIHLGIPSELQYLCDGRVLPELVADLLTMIEDYLGGSSPIFQPLILGPTIMRLLGHGMDHRVLQLIDRYCSVSTDLDRKIRLLRLGVTSIAASEFISRLRRYTGDHLALHVAQGVIETTDQNTRDHPLPPILLPILQLTAGSHPSLCSGKVIRRVWATDPMAACSIIWTMLQSSTTDGYKNAVEGLMVGWGRGVDRELLIMLKAVSINRRFRTMTSLISCIMRGIEHGDPAIIPDLLDVLTSMIGQLRHPQRIELADHIDGMWGKGWDASTFRIIETLAARPHPDVYISLLNALRHGWGRGMDAAIARQIVTMIQTAMVQETKRSDYRQAVRIGMFAMSTGWRRGVDHLLRTTIEQVVAWFCEDPTKRFPIGSALVQAIVTGSDLLGQDTLRLIHLLEHSLSSEGTSHILRWIGDIRR